jgi:hypothetical protein
MWRDRKMPLLRRWSARWAENPEVLVRFQRVARSRRKSRAVRHFSIKEAILSLDPRRACATSFGAYKQVGSTPTSGSQALLRGKMLHGGALEFGSSNNRHQHSPRSRGIRYVSTSKVGSTPSFPPILDREHHWPVHPALNRRGQGSSPWRSTNDRGVAYRSGTWFGTKVKHVRLVSPRRETRAIESPARRSPIVVATMRREPSRLDVERRLGVRFCGRRLGVRHLLAMQD